jgi:hemolysin activation/secretion protein
MMKKITNTLLLSCVAMGAAAAPQAPISTPDAGSIQNQIEQKFVQPLPDVVLKKSLPEEFQAKSGAVTVTVQQFKFEGNTLVQTAKLDQVVAPYLNQKLDLDGLKGVTELIAQAYRDAGWVVRAYLPRQEIADGTVMIQVVEGIFGKASITEMKTDRVEASRLVAIVNAAQPKGQFVSSKAIDRALLLLDDMPGITVAGNLVAGENLSETDLLLGVADRAGYNGNFGFDNYGSLSTGVNRVTANVTLNSPLRLGDSLSLNLLKTTGSEYERVGYMLPIGSDGWRVGAHASNMSYQLQGSFASSDGHGTSRTNGFDASYPIVRSQQENLNLTWIYDSKSMINYSAGAVSSDYGIRVMSVSLAGNRVDTWMGGGLTTGSTTLTSGHNNLGTDATTANTTGNYSKVVLSLARQQSLTERVSGFASVTSQYANKNLDGSEKIFVAGTNGVRAYQGGDGSGTTGQTLTLELRNRVNEQLTATTFYDYGRVQSFKDNSTAAGGTNTQQGYPNSFNIAGYGASIAWQDGKGSELRATVARRVGTNPNANSNTGMDSDGTLKKNRLWVSASFGF